MGYIAWGKDALELASIPFNPLEPPSISCMNHTEITRLINSSFPSSI